MATLAAVTARMPYRLLSIFSLPILVASQTSDLRFTNIAPNTEAVHPEPSPTTTPQSTVSCQDACIQGSRTNPSSDQENKKGNTRNEEARNFRYKNMYFYNGTRALMQEV